MATIVDYRKLRGEIEEALTDLPPEAVKAVYHIGPDHMGETVLFFRIVLADEALKNRNVLDVTQSVEKAIDGKLQSLENWGLFPHFNYRLESDQRLRPNPAWENNGIPR